MQADEILTLREMLDLLPDDPADRPPAAALLGLVLPLLDTRADADGQDFGWHFDRLVRAFELGQADAFFDGYGRLCGAALWTSVGPDAERRMLARGPRAAGAADLSRRGNAWLLDLHCLYGNLPLLLEMLRDRYLADAATLTYSRQVRGRRVAKQIARTDRSGLVRRIDPRRPPGRAAFLRSSDGALLLQQAAQFIAPAIERGLALTVLRSCPRFAALPLPVALQRLETPLSLGQYRLHRSTAGTPVALLTWAWFERELVDRPAGAPAAVQRHEWNAGNCLVVCDAVASQDGAGVLMSDLDEGLFPGETLHVLPGWFGGAQAGLPRAWDAAGRRELVRRPRPTGRLALAELLELAC